MPFWFVAFSYLVMFMCAILYILALGDNIIILVEYVSTILVNGAKLSILSNYAPLSAKFAFLVKYTSSNYFTFHLVFFFTFFKKILIKKVV